MKFFAFHLMPYGPLDLEEAARHRAAWVVLPNSLYDPKKGADLYNRYLDELEYADALGFDGICVNEHHQTAYGLMPQPSVLAGALSRRTKNAKIAILGRALPLINNPMAVAEEYAIIDNITRGRLIAGFVRGIGAEYHATGINPAHALARFREAHDMILRAWTQPGPFAFEGEHYHFQYVNLWPRPYQQPHPPVWIPSTGSLETVEWAASPERKYPFIVTFAPAATMIRNLVSYHATAAEFGYAAAPEQLGWAVPMYVGETDAQAREEARAHIEVLFNNLLRMPLQMLMPPGYVSAASLQRFFQGRKGVTAGFDSRMTIERLLEQDVVLIGSAATVRDKIEHYRREAKFGNLICMMQFGTLPADLTRRNMERVAAEIMPHFRARQ
jgi:alkanesulfonate monooxygenase SsuD/methylene tetrahydromethanopterin reductase-like flavin-dependent oxidoreductase (luciferase family)